MTAAGIGINREREKRSGIYADIPVAVRINNKVECISHVEKNAILRMGVAYCETDKYSGYEIYVDMASGKMYAANTK